MPFVHIYSDDDFDEEAGDYRTGPERYSYEKPELADANGCSAILSDQNSGLVNRLFGKAVPSYLKLTDDDKATLKAFLPALKNSGIRRLHLSYDGGNDEGFGTFERGEDENGQSIAVSALLENSAFLNEIAPFVTDRYEQNQHPVFRPGAAPDVTRMIGDYLEHELPVILVSLLLGRGYGTGEYELYGRAVADLNTMTITDDPQAPYPHGPSN